MTGLQQRLVYGLVILNVAIHIGDLPQWIPIVALVFVAWRWLADLIRIPCPGRAGAAVFGLVGSYGIWLEFGHFFQDPAPTALLVFMISLKTLEIRGYRDLMMVTYLCLLLLMCKLLASQTLAMGIFLGLDVVAVLALMHLYHLPEKGRGFPWRRSFRLLLQSTPVVLVLFALFPRFNFSLFQRRPQTTASVGFSDRLRPGSIANLAQSPEIAFRAFFLGGYIPTVSRLYWRGAVLSHSDGLNWDVETSQVRPASFNATENRVQVLTETGGSTWVFTLDWPTEIKMVPNARQFELRQAPGLTFFLRSPLSARESYEFSFELAPQAVTWADDVQDFMAAPKVSAKVRSLVEGFVGSQTNLDALIERLRDFFVNEKFTYSLSPPEVADLDEFLFTTRQGFCEHYAGATATLLRLAGIPARVVVGYQGGSPSLMGDYLIVHQSDAHAWVEYWHAHKKQWVRLDPTAWIAEDRVLLGGQSYLERQFPNRLSNYENSWMVRLLGENFPHWLTRGRLLLDQGEILWINFMLRYDLSYQQKLFARLGWVEISRTALFGLTFLALVMVYFLVRWLLLRSTRLKPDMGLFLYRELCRRLAHAGLLRQPSEGPATYADRALARWPGQAEQLRTLFNRLIRLRYNDETLSREEYGEILRQLKSLRVDSARRH